MKNNRPATLLLCFMALTFLSGCRLHSQKDAIVLSPLGSAVPAEQAGSLNRFEAMKQVLQAKCMSCHNGNLSNVPNFNLTTEAQFLSNGLVVAGSPADSKLIYRLRNYTIDNGVRNMPPSGTLTNTEYTLVTNWVIMLPSETPADTPANSNEFVCDSNELPDSLNARRLSKNEYYNAVRSLLVRAFGMVETEALLAQNNVYARLPEDISITFATGDKNFSAVHAREFFEIANVLSASLVQSTRLSRFVATYINYNRGTCIYTDATNLSLDCRTTLARNFLLRAWGRPADTLNDNANNELASFMQEFQLATTTTAGIEAMIFKTLLSPQFLFHLQISVEPTANTQVYRLTSYAIARRIAFIFNQTLPDETLLNFAATQNLAEEVPFVEAVNYASQNLDTSLTQFTREWLHIKQLPAYRDQTHPKFQLITQGVTVNENLKTVMIQEVIDLVNYIAKNNRPASELFTSNVSLARDPSLMRLYNQTVPAPTTVTEQNAVRFPSGERSGLLTRAAMLFSGSHSENPILRGIHIRKYLMCLQMSDPPPGLPADSFTPPMLDANLTTRQRYHNKTSGVSCVGCHSQINPVGFAFSKYNAFGSYQNSEPIFDINNQLVNSLSTDARVNLQLALAINLDTSDAVDFSEYVSRSKEFKKCITEKFYTYANGLSEKPASNFSCSMNRMYQGLDTGATLQDFFKSTVLDSRFRFRKIDR